MPIPSLLVLVLLCSCQKETTSDFIMISSIRGKAFTVSFDKPNGVHWCSVDFDPEYTKAFQATLPQGHYIATAITDDKRDTLQTEFKKGPQWLELSFDW